MNRNLRGINYEKKWLALSNKTEESRCDIICLQETMRENFDMEYFRKFCPKKFDKFEFLPSVGDFGGIIIIWNGSLFSRELAFANEISISVKLTCNLSAGSWILTNIYGPCQPERRANFINWFSNIDKLYDTNWIVMGDFNFIRQPSDRNKLGGNVNDMLIFNEAISYLGIIELPMKGRKFTWSNMQ
jgi:exonuclease III